MHRSQTALLLLLFSACTTVSEPPSVYSEVRVHSQHVFRGVSQTDGKVIQALSHWTVDLGEGQRFRLGTFLNADGTNDSGDGIFPDGNGGQITRVEFEPTWIWDLADGTLSAGIVNRSHPNLAGYGDTSEAVLEWESASRIFALQPRFKVYYDLEDGDGLYTLLGVGRSRELKPGWSLDTSFTLAYADRDQATVLYQADEAGFADLTAQAVLHWKKTSNLDISGTFAASTIVSNHLADSLKANGRDDANAWLGLGMSWTF